MKGKEVLYIYGKVFRWIALAIIAAFNALGWVLNALYANDKRQDEEEENLPIVDVTKPYSKDYWRYDEDGYRIL